MFPVHTKLDNDELTKGITFYNTHSKFYNTAMDIVVPAVIHN
jgi:hypothetical protein